MHRYLLIVLAVIAGYVLARFFPHLGDTIKLPSK